MDITITPNRTAGCRKPNFTAQLRGSAIREAIKSAKDSFQLGEVKEIIENVNLKGDKDTIIDCTYDGFVKVKNAKLGETVYSEKLKRNEKSQNPYLEFLRVFNSDSNINKYESSLINRVFSHSKNKQGLYNLLKTYDFTPKTKLIIQIEASKYPEISVLKNSGIEFVISDLEQLKERFLKQFAPRF